MNVNDTSEAPEAQAPAPTAGMILMQAREAAGLTIDDVAMQLKLAPRQVVAIERDDFANLPGRTFIRGFVRNYARLLKLDTDAVLGALTGEHATPAEALFLGMCIERKLEDRQSEQSYVMQLRNRYPNSPEARAIASGACQ